MSAPATLRQYSLAAVVAAGLAAIWCVLVAWVIGMIQTAALQSVSYEQPYFRMDGEPVILRYPSGVRSTTQEVVDLSGQVTQANASQLLAPQQIIPRAQTQALMGSGWNTRLAGVNDGGTPATYWYLVHDGRVNGSAYGVGYHSVTRQLAGYFGRQGFTTSLPPRADWFPVEGAAGLSLATPVVVNSEPSWATERVLYLLAAGKLWSIDPQQRRVRALADAPLGATIGWLWDLGNTETLARPTDAVAQNAGSAPRTLVIRTDDTCILVDPENGQHEAIPLPQELRSRMFAGCELSGGNLSLLTFGGASRRESDLALQLNPQGQIIRQQAMHLRSYGADFGGETGLAWLFLLAAPFPAGQGPTVFLIPLSLVQTGEADSYAAAFVPSLLRSWPALLGTLVIGAISAAAAYRRQRRYALPGAIGWAVFAFIFGLPGWIAYRFHRAWPVLEDCPACDQPAPRDREACTECGAFFPQPELKGVEVFA